MGNSTEFPGYELKLTYQNNEESQSLLGFIKCQCNCTSHARSSRAATTADINIYLQPKIDSDEASETEVGANESSVGEELGSDVGGVMYKTGEQDAQ